MNSLIFVLVLASGEGGINTDLKFKTMADCWEAAKAVTTPTNSAGSSAGFRYMAATCVPAKNLALKDPK